MASVTNETLPVFSSKRRRVEYEEICDDGEAPGTRGRKVARLSPNNYSNLKRVSLFCQERVFNESDATATLSDTPGGKELLLQPGATALIKKTINIARVIVFNETVSQRIERCKNYQVKLNPAINTPEIIIEGWEILTSILKNNDIDVSTFAHVTFKHLTRQIRNKNILLFHGPPSTGKTMIMESLVNLHYNVVRQAGMPTKKKFFASLLNRNALFMTDSLLHVKSRHMQEWSLLAAGTPLCTEVGKAQFVRNCVVYICAPAPVQGAIAEHTTAFCFYKKFNEYTQFSVFVWLKLWSDFGLQI